MKDNQAKYPQLRFKGFTDHWEKRTLGQTTTKAKSYSLSRDVERDHETGYRYIHYGDIHTGVADIVTEHTKLPNIEPANYDELRVNDLVVADASEDYQGIAEPAVVVGLPTHLVAGLHTITLRPSSASSLYLYYLLHTDSFKHFGYQMGTGLKVFGISWSNLSKFTFMIPSRPEQEMIVKLIESVDNLIAVNQRKLAKLKELKQGYLQKMFPQNGSKFPQLRFAGFADAWEQRKLGDLVNVDTGSRNHQDAVQGGRYPFYVRSENIEALDEYDFDETAILVPGDGRIGEIFHFVQGKFALHQRVYKLDGFTGVMPEFLIQLLRHGFRKHALRMNAQGTVPSLRKPVFTEWQVLIPNTKEQKPISYLLRCLDKTIALHQRKLEKLQELKKGYLQKMFC
ncbi:restriction endonuclease subunit S [Lentilactobacillus buchneri]|uniref:restriction endonuclease subunit S n=1 Tax=Lentilactobacillus buchneri TaxID=1581 RepID=UPI0021A85648|nr:restriction endonuclease subunit S [Lentilactobacillus buchneri]MCT3558478.1 restriction endonuclease subunit S [Lentilactobacillus buchneri]MCT3562866.1 restriction endonuclease subunit S [Lentilactobacillus buchneri]